MVKPEDTGKPVHVVTWSGEYGEAVQFYPCTLVAFGYRESEVKTEHGVRTVWTDDIYADERQALTLAKRWLTETRDYYANTLTQVEARLAVLDRPGPDPCPVFA